MNNFEDLYTDYLISSSSYTTATGMGSLLSIKHDKITRELSRGGYDSKFLWEYAKPYVQELTQAKDTIVLSFDDSIEEKQYTDESELNCWHYDHVFNRSVKGVNFLTALVEVSNMRLPCAVEFVKKDTWETDAKTGKKKRKSSKTKFIIALKSNRKVALSLEKKQNKEYISIETLQPGQSRTCGRDLARRVRFSAVACKASLQKRG